MVKPPAPSPADIGRYRRNLQDEIDSAAIYTAMADAESKAEVASLYRKLADTEARHANFWRRHIQRAGGDAPEVRASWRARLMIWFAHRLGANAVLPTVMQQEASNRAVYDDQRETGGTTMPAQERSHARLLAHLADHAGGGWNGTRYAQLEGRHGVGGGNALRAMVLGANDGLVSMLSLVMGVAGAAFSSTALLATAAAGTLAGACSMAMGEWISVQSARELYQRQIAVEVDELEQVPAEEKEELVLIYRAKGFEPDEARRIAERMIDNKDTALDTLVREELGLDPDELGGSALVAAASSFCVFLLGALFPVLPLFVLDGQAAVLASALSSGLGLFLIGAAITVFTGASAFWCGLRQLAIGALAAAVTYGMGHLFGIAIGG